MARTLRNITLPLLIAACIAQAPASEDDGIRLTGVVVSVTERTLERQEALADTAIYNPASGAIDVVKLNVRTRQDEDTEVHAESPEGLVVILGQTKDEEEVLMELDYEDIRAYGAGFPETAAEGDILLRGKPGDPARASMEDEGVLESLFMIWSERFGRLILPETFEQRAILEDGTLMTITGAALAADRDFRDWTYFAGTESEGRVVFLLPEATDEEDQKDDSE